MQDLLNDLNHLDLEVLTIKQNLDECFSSFFTQHDTKNFNLSDLQTLAFKYDNHFSELLEGFKHPNSKDELSRKLFSDFTSKSNLIMAELEKNPAMKNDTKFNNKTSTVSINSINVPEPRENQLTAKTTSIGELLNNIISSLHTKSKNMNIIHSKTSQNTRESCKAAKEEIILANNNSLLSKGNPCNNTPLLVQEGLNNSFIQSIFNFNSAKNNLFNIGVINNNSTELNGKSNNSELNLPTLHLQSSNIKLSSANRFQKSKDLRTPFLTQIENTFRSNCTNRLDKLGYQKTLENSVNKNGVNNNVNCFSNNSNNFIMDRNFHSLNQAKVYPQKNCLLNSNSLDLRESSCLNSSNNEYKKINARINELTQAAGNIKNVMIANNSKINSNNNINNNKNLHHWNYLGRKRLSVAAKNGDQRLCLKNKQNTTLKSRMLVSRRVVRSHSPNKKETQKEPKIHELYENNLTVNNHSTAISSKNNYPQHTQIPTQTAKSTTTNSNRPAESSKLNLPCLERILLNRESPFLINKTKRAPITSGKKNKVFNMRQDCLFKRVKTHLHKYVLNKLNEILQAETVEKDILFKLPKDFISDLSVSHNQRLFSKKIKDIYTIKLNGLDSEIFNHNKEVLISAISKDTFLLSNFTNKTFNEAFLEFMNSSEFYKDVEIMRLKDGLTYAMKFKHSTFDFYCSVTGKEPGSFTVKTNPNFSKAVKSNTPSDQEQEQHQIDFNGNSTLMIDKKAENTVESTVIEKKQSAS